MRGIVVAEYRRTGRKTVLPQHTCTNCGTVHTSDDYCPECGQWVDDEGYEEFELGDVPEEAPIPSLPYNSIPCPSCGASNPPTNRHCEECGARISQGALPVAPQPMIQTSAGVRAAMAIGGVLIVVVLFAMLFNVFGGDDTTETTLAGGSTTTTISTSQAPLGLVPIISQTCSSELNESFACELMFDGDPTTAWNDNRLMGEGASITVTFDGTYSLEQIIIKNLDEETRFKRNYRIAGFKITTDDNPTGQIDVLEDKTGQQIITFPTLRSTTLTIEVQSTYPAEEVDDQSAFTELVVQEIEVFGRKVQ